MQTTSAFLAAAVALAACHSNNNKPADAPKSDGAKTDAPVDAKVFMDAPPMSTVRVVPNCTNVPNGQVGQTIMTVGLTFSPSTATITHGQYVKFISTGSHNFQNQPGAPAGATFSSGTPGVGTTCLQFTVAGSYPFECINHVASGMVGTLTVN